MTERINLDQQADWNSISFAQINQAIKNRLPFLVARKIVVGNKETTDALCKVEPYKLLDIVRRPVARFAALNIDYRAERAL